MPTKRNIQPTNAKRNNAASKQAAKSPPTTATTKPATTVSTPETKAAKPAAHITRTAATVAAMRAAYDTFSERDAAYLSFYAKLAKRNNGRFTVADIVALGVRAPYAGSNKPHDAGVLERLCKAGIFATSNGGHDFLVTPLGLTHAAYAKA